MANIARTFVALAILAAAMTVKADARPDASQPAPHTYRSPSGTLLRILLDDSNVGPEVTMGEITFAPNQDSGDHQHGAKEIFYVLSGELEHVVNGRSQILTTGMAGYVNPPDKVRHKTGPAGAKAIVVWVPGDEGKKIASRWTKVE